MKPRVLTILLVALVGLVGLLCAKVWVPWLDVVRAAGAAHWSTVTTVITVLLLLAIGVASVATTWHIRHRERLGTLPAFGQVLQFMGCVFLVVLLTGASFVAPITGGMTGATYVSAGGNAFSAVASTPAGGVVIFGPGSYYNCSNILKRGVNYQLHGSWLTWTNQLTDGGYGIFDDRFLSGATSNSIVGFGDARLIYSNGRPTVDAGSWTYHDRTSLSAPAGYMGAVVITNSLSKMVMQNIRVDAVLTSLGAGPGAITCVNGTNDFNGCSVYDVMPNFAFTNYDATLDQMETTYSSASGLWWQHGRMTFKNSPMIQGRSYGVYSRDDLGTGQHDFYWDAAYVMGRHYTAGASNSNWRVWCSFDELVETNFGLAGSHLGGGKVYYRNFGKILSQGNNAGYTDIAVDSSFPTELWMSGNKLSSGGSSFFTDGSATSKGGTNILSIQHWEDVGGRIGVGIRVSGAGGKTIIQGGEISVSNGIVAQVAIGGTLDVRGAVLRNTTSSSNACIVANTNTLTLRGCTVIGPTAKWSIASTVTNQIAAYYTALNLNMTNIGLLGGSVTVTNTQVR